MTLTDENWPINNIFRNFEEEEDGANEEKNVFLINLFLLDIIDCFFYTIYVLIFTKLKIGRLNMYFIIKSDQLIGCNMAKFSDQDENSISHFQIDLLDIVL